VADDRYYNGVATLRNHRDEDRCAAA